ncbi:Cytochrome c oxidase subunit 5b-2, mitochondrial [Porphyridium purpureum]|uniref:Cytochrome c oxidase subunit 5b-2, mitochondrial n=1 Tax=Porphyridium purpureum TaxID=35688 RepID=A0A5J4YMW7_PORPP|nr:Cytochrome c oxidase subunit 5b-2, mitochondrial [Porphyridium purpureum]|eukprot:POR1118..scf244_11
MAMRYARFARRAQVALSHQQHQHAALAAAMASGASVNVCRLAGSGGEATMARRAFGGDAHDTNAAAYRSELDKLYDIKPTPPGQVPDSMTQAAGLEKAEIENPKMFAHNDMIVGPFGTTEEPTYVESAFDSRIVGCTGDEAPHDHDILWILVEAGKQACCPLCEQVFELKQI